jgi:hypothetical protein
MSEDKHLTLVKSITDRETNFSELLNTIKGVTDKKRVLWSEIYRNAITDRENSGGMLKALITLCGDNSTELATHGRTIVTLIEKMSKANDQLLKLVDQVSMYDNTKKDPEESSDNIYSLISETNRSS